MGRQYIIESDLYKKSTSINKGVDFFIVYRLILYIKQLYTILIK